MCRPQLVVGARDKLCHTGIVHAIMQGVSQVEALS
jgi:hypothetical protein